MSSSTGPAGVGLLARRIDRSEREVLNDLRRASMLDANPLAGATLLLLIILLAAAFWWAETAMLDEVTRGTGRVIPSQREQVIQSLEGGILSELLVREGDIVQAGDVLLRIDDTRFGANYRESIKRRETLLAATARLEAEATGAAAPQFPDGLPEELVQQERKLFDSRQRQLQESIASLATSLRLATEELDMTAPLVAAGAVSEVEVLRLRREVSELRGRIQERRNAFRAEARAELAEKDGELAALAEVVTARQDQVRRTVVRSPVRGTVKDVRVTTVGGVIQPGMHIMAIVPLEDQLLVEARIRPADVAFLRPGLDATVKITAYDYSIYGGLQGELELISADTIEDEERPGESFYRIRVRTDRAFLPGKNGEPLPIIPGMTASVEVLTGQKSVLDYILKPILKTRDQALREK